MLRTRSGADVPTGRAAGRGRDGVRAATTVTVRPDALLTQVMASAGGSSAVVRLPDGTAARLGVRRWAAPACTSDGSLLDRAIGPVIDVGCGPGRLTAALRERGVDVLGLDVLPDVPVLARRAGAPVHVGDVFGDVPRPGAWGTALLADGNVGIGGDPPRLLARLRGLLAPAGTVLVELGDVDWAGDVRLEDGRRVTHAFPWASVGPSGVRQVAAAAGMRVTDRWSSGGRRFAALAA